MSRETLLQHPKVKALGEIGLDYHWGAPKETQTPVFIQQLEIAARPECPSSSIHATHGTTRSHAPHNWEATGLPCIMHCFTGDSEAARQCLDLGFHLAFGGVATFPKAAEIREAARITPANRLLLETDSPYLAPVPHRGKRNEPAL